MQTLGDSHHEVTDRWIKSMQAAMATESVQPSGYDPNSLNTFGAHHLPPDAKPAEVPEVDVVFKKDVQSDSDANAVNNNTVNLAESPSPDLAHLHSSKVEPHGVLTTARNEKADAIMEAHKERVEVEANAYLQSEMRKVHARANTAQEMAERKKIHEEAKALEILKRDEARAEQLQSNAEAKAEKIVEHAKQEAAKLKAHANEVIERAIADADARAEREKAAEEEARKVGIAELVDEVEHLKATGELPAQEKKGIRTRLKEKVSGHH